MKNKGILIALGVGVAAYLIFKPKIAQRPAVVPQQYYNAPPRGTIAFQNWANTILQVYGQSKWLFEPGGPFYNNKLLNEKELNKVLSQPVYDLPKTTNPTPIPSQDNYGSLG